MRFSQLSDAARNILRDVGAMDTDAEAWFDMDWPENVALKTSGQADFSGFLKKMAFEYQNGYNSNWL